MVRDRLVPGNLGSILLYVISFHEQDRMNGVVKEPARQDNERWCVCVCYGAKLGPTEQCVCRDSQNQLMSLEASPSRG